MLIAHPSAELYGSDRVMVETIEGLQLRGWQVVTTLPAPGPLIPEIERRGGRVVVSPAPVLRKSALRPLGMIRLIGTSIRSLMPSIRLVRAADMVYVSTLTIPSWIFLGRLLRRPVVCHVHESERAAPMWLRRTLAGPLLAADHLLVNSEFSRSVLLESYPSLRDRSEVVYNGVPGPTTVVPARTELTGPVRLVFVGRLSPRKGPQVAVELVRRLVESGTPAHLALVGSVFPGYEWFETELRHSVAEAGLTDAVDFVGFSDDVWKHLADADVALVPSQGDEPFGNTAVEAVLAGRPVVVSSSSGLDEAVAGYASAQRVAADDIDGWVAAVQRVVTQWPEYRARAAADVTVARGRHAPHIYQETMADRLDELAAGKVTAMSAEPIPAPDSDPEVVVAMLTYRRPDDLVEALPRILTHTEAAGARLMVVDNDPAGTARDAVAAFGDRVQYVNETRPGIAAARNRALDEAPADALLVFIDDDERPTDRWLDLLLDTYRRHGSAAVVGPVVSEYDVQPDAWVAAGRFFDRRRLPTGTTVDVAATNNLLLDLAQIHRHGLRFDEAFGASGGSDTLFTRRLVRAGGRMIWCDEAVVIDKVPASRTTRDWVLRRAFRSGNSWTRTSLELAPTRLQRTAVRGQTLAIGAARIAAGAGAVALGSVTRRLPRRVRGTRTVARGAGMAAGAFGYVYQEYRRPTPAAGAAA